MYSYEYNATPTGLIKWKTINRQNRQGMVPDLRFYGLKFKGALGSKNENNQGTTDRCACLGEVKTINGGQEYEKDPNTHRAAVEARAKKIPGEYEKKATKIDNEYNDGGTRVLDHLRTFRTMSFCFGSYGEFNEEVDEFLEVVCRKIAEKEWMESGYLTENDCYSVVKSNVTSELGCLSLRTAANVLLKRLSNISSDTSKSAKREKRETYNYHLRNEERAEMIRNQNSQHPDGEVFINCHPLNEKNYK